MKFPQIARAYSGDSRLVMLFAAVHESPAGALRHAECIEQCPLSGVAGRHLLRWFFSSLTHNRHRDLKKFLI